MTDFVATKARFHLPKGVIYLDGNSLGPLPEGAMHRAQQTIESEWGEMLIRAWNLAGWMDQPRRVGDKIVPLIGAEPGTVVMGDTLSIKMYQALAAALAMRPDRKIVLSDTGNFPTDLYMAKGLIDSLARGHVLKTVAPEAVEDAIDESVAALMLTHIDYGSGRVHDMARLTEKAHAAGALAIWDLAHSAGATPVDLAGCRADFAAGCTYKYLNGGPGSPAFIAVAKTHQTAAQNPLSGWWGHAVPFAFDRDFRPDAGIKRFLCGTQPIISLRGVDVALDAMEGVEVAALRQKSLALTEFFMARVNALLPELEIVTPREASLRGSQVGISFDKGYAVIQAMIERGVIGDFRAPDLMRFGFAPLYVRFQDAWDAADILADCIKAEVWRDPRFNRKLDVT